MVSVAHRLRVAQGPVHRGGAHRRRVAPLAGRTGAIRQRAQREDGALVFAEPGGSGGTVAVRRLGVRAWSGGRGRRGPGPGALREPGVAAAAGAGGRGTRAAGGTGSGLHDRKGEGGGDEGAAVCPAARAFPAARPAAAGHRLSPEVSGIARAAGRGRGGENRAGIPAGERAAGAGICGDGGGAGGEAGTLRRGSRRGEPALAEAGEAVSPRDGGGKNSKSESRNPKQIPKA